MRFAMLILCGVELANCSQAPGDSSLGSCGTVFAVTTSGKERVLHSFGKTSEDGINPSASVMKTNGALYGTTLSGDASGRGQSSGSHSS